MHLATELGKGASVDLSTLSENASGQEWISQRLGVSCETIRDFTTISVPGPARMASTVAFGQQSQAQCIEFDEARCIGLIIGACIVFERDMRF